MDKRKRLSLVIAPRILRNYDLELIATNKNEELVVFTYKRKEKEKCLKQK